MRLMGLGELMGLMGAKWAYWSGDGVGDGDCMGSGGVVSAGETDGADGAKWGY